MLNKIILATINESSSHLDAMQSDAFENPETYSGWFYPLRYVLSLRYLNTKQQVLSHFRQKKTYPIKNSDFKQALIDRLMDKQSNTNTINNEQTDFFKNPVLSSFLKAKFVYPLLLLVLGACIYNANNWYQQKRMENVLANYLPYYSDLLHRKLLLTHNDGSQAKITAIDESIEKTQHKILSELPEKNNIRSTMQVQLLNLKDPALDSEKIMLGFKAMNTLLDAHQQPYYLTPKSFTMPCSSLIDAPIEQMMMLKELESLMSNNNPELCRTTMMTTYKVDERNQLFYNQKQKSETLETELPLFHVQRIDKVPAVDGALGLTFKDRGIGSIILIDRIKNFARESILPALTFQGRNYIIPYWMQGYYEIEEAVTKAYKKDINQIYSDKKERRQVKSLIKRLIKDKSRMQNSKIQQTMQRTNSNNDQSIFGNGFDAISVMLGKDKKIKPKIKQGFNKDEALLLKKLEEALYPSIEYHEAYHQINKKDWPVPIWLNTTFKDTLSDNAIDHTMEELGAYLSQLANTDQGQNIWLSKLLIFSLNPMTKGQAEYYASSIIFNTLESIYMGEEVTASYSASVDDKARIFSTLLEMDSNEIRLLSSTAYKILFERDVPTLSY